MVNVELLRKKIKESGMTITFIAKKSGILRESLYNKLNKTTDFKASEISSLANVLNLSKKERDDIFFANDSEFNSQ